MIRSALSHLPRPRALLSFPLSAVFLGVACALSGVGSEEGIFVGSLFALACIFGTVRVWTSGNIALPSTPLAYAGVPLVVAGCISAMAPHLYFLMSFAGTGLEVGSIGFLLAAALVAAIASCWSRGSAALFVYAFESVVAIRGLFMVVFALMHNTLSWGLSVQSALCFGVCSLIGVILFEQVSALRPRVFHGIVAGLSLAGLAVSFSLSAGLLTFFCAVVVLGIFWRAGKFATLASVPVATMLLGAALAALSLFALRHPPAPPASNASFSDSALAVGPENLGSIKAALIGAGPNTFPATWNEYRPVELNATAFWKVAPESPYDTLVLLAITLGLLGLLAFLVYPFAFFATILRQYASVSRELRIEGIFGATLALAVFGFAAAVFFPIGPSLFLACAAAFGSCLGFVSLPHPREFHLAGPSRVAACIAIGLFALAVFSIGALQLIAAHADKKGQLLSGQDTAAAASELETAAKVWPVPQYQKDAAQGIIAAALQKAQAQLAAGSVDGSALNAATQKALVLIDQSTAEDPHDPDLMIAQASVYLSLASIGVPGDAQKAADYLKIAQTLAPTRPDIFYDEAVVAIFESDNDAARADLLQALKLKPDYAGAQVLLGTL
jgi:tetratricopeptide (TPR) repeat protein